MDSIATKLNQLLNAASIPVESVSDGNPLVIRFLPEATPEQRTQAMQIRDVDLPTKLAEQEATTEAYENRAKYGFPATVEGRAFTFGGKPEDFPMLAGLAAFLLRRDIRGVPDDEPVYMKDKDGVLHRWESRAAVWAFLDYYGDTAPRDWAIAWAQQEALRAAQQES